MWKGPGQDPGGGPDPGPPEPPPSSNQELSDLKDQFEQQQVLIAQLKEMIRKSEQSNVTQEKVDEYMNTLSKRSARAKRIKKDDDNSSSRKAVDIPASQKISLLRQQVEENKAKFAERGKNQKGIEEMVTQLKAQLDDSQQLINQTPLNLSLAEVKTEYSENSSSQELYMILLTKEKRITDLTSKVQKLESTVLDLQENLKEKDSVLDARTKAITLMTENLSRKGKNTLDALDETKEQMRKMQEHFVSLESEMKARQMKLLEDLKLKNYEITDLQELNSNLERQKLDLITENNQLKEVMQSNPNEEISTLKLKIEELEKLNLKLKQETPEDSQSEELGISHKEKLLQLEAENNRLSSLIAQHEFTIKDLNEEINHLKKKESEIGIDNEEVIKLKKQLDESNKNMIKVKAQHKSKVKELTKKIDAFKKISDVNAEIVKLESENSRLNQKIAELEEEKGTLQLKLVESDSVKGADQAEQIKDLEDKVQDHIKMSEEKDKIISILEAEISRLKSEIGTLTEKLSNLSHLENAQVTSEMTSIQFEEQMDSLEKEKEKLIMEKESATKEKEELLESIELLKKEKQDIAAKLEHYIQENMELIDKLEKLSAEKVSSAESIEIVEGLTQQEKLELEAYQKNLDLVAGNLKSSEENLPQTVDLNETVNELTEETSELLQKIELFTVERREVMEKMEQLKQENNHLNLKIKEIENNRDVLAETYEQLQNEKELLDSKLEATEKENENLKERSEAREDVENLKKEMDTLREKLEESHRLEQELDERRKQISELNEEINSYKSIIEEKKIEFDALFSTVKELQIKLEEKEAENRHLSNNIIDLNRTLSDLENDSKNLQIKVHQLEEQKINLNQLIDKNQEELEAISNTEWENRRLLESKDNEITKLVKEKDNTESVITNLQKIIKEKDEKFHKISSELKEKYLSLQKQLEENSGNLQNIRSPLERKIEELTVKNKEQLEKMKKIAANLKKKTQAYQELEDKTRATQEKYETELREKDMKIEEAENKISHQMKQLEDLEVEVSRLQKLLNEKSQLYESLWQDFEMFQNNKERELRVLDEKNIELQQIITDLRIKAEKNEINLQQELLQTKENLGSQVSANESALQSKIQEMEMIIETQENELIRYRERVSKLEEGFASVEERRLSLERKANELGAQLEEKSVTCEEISMSEDMLEKRLAVLAAHDEAVEKRLEEAVAENQELNQQNKKLNEKNEKLKKKLEQTLEKLRETQSQQNIVEDLESQNEMMKKQIHQLEEDLKNLQNEYERILEDNKNEFDKINGDWQVQFDEVLKEKNELMVRCERFEEELKEICEKEIVFNDELIEYKTKLEKSETEIKNYEEQIEKLSKENEDYKKQIYSEEIGNLKQIIEEKDLEIEKYQKQNLRSSNALSSFFDNSLQQNSELSNKLEEIQTEKLHLEEELITLKNQLESSKQQIEDLEKKIQDLQSQTTIEVTVDSTISDPQEKKESPQRIPTFIWSEQKDDPFDFISNQTVPVEETIKTSQETSSQAIPKSENTQEELLNKIKTLEFMLFNVEKEKDDALLQCHELSNELTRLVYERENANPPGNPELETQILTDNETKDTPDTCQELRKIEFEPTRPPQVSSFESGAVVEEPIEIKDAYLCYDEDNVQKVENPSVESQVLSETDIADTPETRQELLQIEFEPSKPPMSSTEEPIKEEQFSTKDAYLCYGVGDGGNRDTFGENDDGWGWGPEEVKLEEEHVQKTDAAPSRQIDILKEKVRVLELERENYLEEIKQLQIKSGKLIKKLKEFKQRNEQLSQARKKSESDLFNLDDTIQEELKLQIQQVEKKLRETTVELEKEKNEKSAIMKKVDVLTAANERMVEMKEKQDIELLGWQQNYRELSAKLERFEWGDDGFSSAEPKLKDKIASSAEDNETLDSLNRKIQELNETIKDLTLDNDELQTLLEEQRTLRINAEKSKSVEPIPTNMKTESEYLEVVNDRNILQDQLKVSVEEKKQLQDQVNELIRKNEELLHKFEDLEKQNEELINLTKNKEEIIAHLNDSQLEQSKTVEELTNKLQIVEKEKFELMNSLKAQEDGVMSEYKQQIDSLISEKNVIFVELQEKNAQINSLKESVDAQIASLKTELDGQAKSGQTLIERNKALTDTITIKDSELNRLSNELATKNNELTTTMEQLNREWEMRVDQRGNDVAESWKLHLESRESEFAQIEQLLKKEINELEEKTNALVNENNELRKNVDAEIRNEVDRVSALQQQINDRQQYISDLTRTLQEKQGENELLRQEIAAKMSDLIQRSDELEKIRRNLEEEKNIVDFVVKILEENMNQAIVRNKDSIVGILSFEFNKIREHEKEILSSKQIREDLNKKLEEFESSCEDYKQKLETLQGEYAALQNSIEEKNRIIGTLTDQLQEIQNLKDYENENSQNLQQNLLEYQQINATISSQLEVKNRQLEEMVNERQNLQRLIQDKDVEINNLKSLLDDKQREHDYAVENLSQEYKTLMNEQIQEIETLKRRLAENENHYEELLSAKNFEIGSFSLQLKENADLVANKTRELEELSLQLNSKIDECTNLQSKIDEQGLLLDEENKQLTELRAIIEDQVLKIEDLKKELFQKSNDYDSLIAEMDMGGSNQHVKQNVEVSRRASEDEDLTEPVSRAELDLALYMLHQRDVRCEELTVELTQLLEERDTLQLRLSNAIREKEELGRKVKKEEDEIPQISSSSGAVPRNKTEISTESVDKAQSSDPLATKLSELKTVGYRKDKTIVDEQELRRFQELSIIQQHRDVASKLPPEAAARLVDASYTLSRDVQSPSKVLLNWLWGKSTPKVNNI